MIVTTGVTLVARTRIDDDAVVEALDRVAIRWGAARGPGSGDGIGTLLFSDDVESAATVVHRVDPAIAGDRADVAAVLRGLVADALRVDVAFESSQTRFVGDAECALVAIAHALFERSGAYAIDDLGHVYDPEELAELAARGEPRAFAFSFVLDAALRATNLAPIDAVPPPVPSTATWPAPSDAELDVVSEDHVGFVIPGTHVTLLTLTRIALALAGDPRAVARPLPVAGSAPAMAAAEALRLAAFGIDLSTGAEPETGGRRGVSRDEIDVVSRGLSRHDAVALLRAVTEALVAGDGPRFVTTPGFLDDDDLRDPSPSPVAIAAYDLEDGTVDVFHLDLDEADPVFLAFVGARTDLRSLLDGPVRSVVAIEIVWDGTEALPPARADAFATLLASALVARGDGIAYDTRGVIYGARELGRLATRRTGRARSWSAAMSGRGTA